MDPSQALQQPRYNGLDLAKRAGIALAVGVAVGAIIGLAVSSKLSAPSNDVRVQG